MFERPTPPKVVVPSATSTATCANNKPPRKKKRKTPVPPCSSSAPVKPPCCVPPKLTPLTNNQAKELALILYTAGVLVLHAVMSPETVAYFRNGIIKYCGNIPELTADANKKWREAFENGDILPVQPGGFGALNYASSFHFPECVQLDSLLRSYLRPLFEELAVLTKSTHWQMLYDRVMMRPSSCKPSKESLHRDNSLGAKLRDVILGSFVNLNPSGQNQYFSCQPRTQLHTTDPKHAGFKKITGPQEKAEFAKNKQLFVVPSGGMIIFWETLKHEVLGNSSKDTVYRKFLGWRLTNSPDMLYPENMALLEKQGVMIQKGGTQERMYPRLWWTNWRGKLVEWGVKYIDDVCCNRTVYSGKDKGQVIKHIPVEVCPPLESILSGSRMYPPMSSRKRRMYTSRPLGDSNKKRKLSPTSSSPSPASSTPSSALDL